MQNNGTKGNRGTKWIRWIARIWSSPIIIYTLMLFVGYTYNWVTTGTADPYAVDDVPLIEVLPPILMFFSVIGLGIAWRWERLGGLITLGFQIITLFLLSIQRPIASDAPRSWIPYLMFVVVTIPGILFWVYGWKSSKLSTSLTDA